MPDLHEAAVIVEAEALRASHPELLKLAGEKLSFAKAIEIVAENILLSADPYVQAAAWMECAKELFDLNDRVVRAALERKR